MRLWLLSLHVIEDALHGRLIERQTQHGDCPEGAVIQQVNALVQTPVERCARS